METDLLELFGNKSDTFLAFASGRTLVFQSAGYMRNAKITAIVAEDGSYNNFIVTLSVGIKLFARFDGQIISKLTVLR